ncbi:MAG TPA: tetratricopeptide repeat protein [Polyangia bacterium]|jgi:hypothetical protein
MTNRSIALGLAVCAAFVSVQARAEDRRETEGRSWFAKGEYEKALDLFAELFAENNDPVYLRNIGRCYQKLRRPEKSIDAFREYLRRAHVRPSEREEINGFIKEMQDLQASQAGTAPTAPAAAPKPFEPAAPPPPSPAAPAAEAAPAPVVPAASPPASAAGATETSTAPGATLVASGESHPDESATPITKRWWFWTGIGAVVVAGVVTAVVLSSGHSAVIPPCPTSTTTCSAP